MVMGTVGYMSPEQVRGEEADATSDIFSFGCVLYEMVTGRRAFARQTAAETMAAILQDEPPEIAASDKDLPDELERVIRAVSGEESGGTVSVGARAGLRVAGDVEWERPGQVCFGSRQGLRSSGRMDHGGSDALAAGCGAVSVHGARENDRFTCHFAPRQRECQPRRGIPQ